MIVTKLVKKALGTMIREALEAKGLPVLISSNEHGAMRYTIDGELLSPGDAALKLGIKW